MTSKARKPDLTRLTVPEASTILDALKAIEAGGEAITFVVDGDERVIGCLTDGDVRRAILKGASLHDRVLPQVMRRDFTAAHPRTTDARRCWTSCAPARSSGSPC